MLGKLNHVVKCNFWVNYLHHMTSKAAMLQFKERQKEYVESAQFDHVHHHHLFQECIHSLQITCSTTQFIVRSFAASTQCRQHASRTGWEERLSGKYPL